MHLASDDPEGQSRVAAFLQGLQEAGWAVGRNVIIDVRWAAGEPERFRRYAMEIVGLTPDVILTSAHTASGRCNRQHGPCRSCLYWSRMRSAQVLSIACRVRAAMPPVSPLPNFARQLVGVAQGDRAQDDASCSATRCLGFHHNRSVWRRQGASPSFGVEISPIGLVSYGPDVLDQHRLAAGYVDRILKGVKPSGLPVQAPTRYELVINLKTAKTLGLDVPPTMPIICLALTDALIPDLIAGYARPGGNVTGMAQSVEGLTGKLVEVALEIVPGAARIGFLSNPMGASMRLLAQSVDTAARTRGIEVRTEEVTAFSEFAPAFDRFSKRSVQAVIVPVNGLFGVQPGHIAQLALTARLPTISAESLDVKAGMLASYGVNRSENFRRAASYVDRILKGRQAGRSTGRVPDQDRADD
jgi:putative tryptophan/tyrosine transport system substrate-binding protein